MKRNLLTYGYIAILTLAAAKLGQISFEHWPLDGSYVIPILCFTAFMVAVELFEVRLAQGGNLLPTATLDVTVWIIMGPAAAMIMEVVGVTVGEGFIKRRPLKKLLYNVPAVALPAGLAGLVYHALPWSDQLRSPLFLLPALVSYLVFSAANTGLFAVVLWLSEGRSLRSVLGQVFDWHFFSGMLSAPLSAFMIFSYQFAGLWSLVLFSIPMIIVHQAHRLFEDMRESHKNTVAALTTALEADEPYTHGHSYRVAQYAVAIGRRMGMSARELETLEYAGMLHDIGKIAITNDIVCKPARLTKDEFDILSSHPVIGGEIVEQMKFLRDAAHLVRHHHERPDGLGYPDGLKRDEISLGSHILNLCDAVDAMCSNRPYRAALTLEQCVEEVRRFRGTQFESDVVDTFASMVEEGSFQIIAQTDGTAQRIQDILRAGPTLAFSSDDRAA